MGSVNVGSVLALWEVLKISLQLLKDWPSLKVMIPLIGFNWEVVLEFACMILETGFTPDHFIKSGLLIRTQPLFPEFLDVRNVRGEYVHFDLIALVEAKVNKGKEDLPNFSQLAEERSVEG